MLSNLTWNAIAGKRFTEFVLNKDMNDSIKIVKSFTDSNVLTDGITEALKHQIKKNKNVDFLELC